MASSVLPFLAWTFLPDLVTNYTQSTLYSIFYRAGTPHPAPGTPQHTKHRQYIHLTVLLLYFAYTLYEAHWELSRQPTLYDVLGLLPNAPEKAVSSRCRRLSLQHHPDKLAPGEMYDDASFVILTTARDVLLDPVKRFAYERFGPEVLSWQNLHTVRDFVDFGLKHTVASYYLGWSVILAVLQWFGWGSTGAFWRWWMLAALASFEVACVTRSVYPQEWLLVSSMPPVMTEALRGFVTQWSMILGLRPYLPFQTVIYLRRASLTFFVGLSRVGPVLSQMVAMRRSRPSLRNSAVLAVDGDEDTKTMRLTQRLEQMVQAQSIETGRLLASNCVAFMPSTAESVVQIRDGGRGHGMEDLRRGVKDWIIKNALRNDPEVQTAYKRAISRRNGGRIEDIDDEIEQ